MPKDSAAPSSIIHFDNELHMSTSRRLPFTRLSKSPRCFVVLSEPVLHTYACGITAEKRLLNLPSPTLWQLAYLLLPPAYIHRIFPFR